MHSLVSPKTTNTAWQHVDAPTVGGTSIILVVEDNPSLRGLLCLILAEEHPSYRVLGAADGRQALVSASEERPRLLLLDYCLDEQMTGIDLYDMLHSAGAERIPTLMLSADVPQEALEARGLSNMGKPFDLDELLAEVDQMLQHGERRVLPPNEELEQQGLLGIQKPYDIDRLTSPIEDVLITAHKTPV